MQTTVLHAALDSGARFDIYAMPHKGLRSYLGDMQTALGKLDFLDQEAVIRTQQALDVLLDFCEAHIEKEEKFVHRALEERAPGSTQKIGAEHGEHRAAFAQLRALAGHLVAVPAAEKAQAAARLYRAFALFVADNLVHMEYEEHAHNAALWAHFSDAEIAEIHVAIVAASSEADLAANARWLVPNLSPAERSALFGGLQASLPEAALHGIIGLVRPHLDADQWQRLAQDLSLK